MKRPTVFLTAAAFGVAILALNSALAAPPRLLPFQGRLTDASGAPVPDGAKVVQFKIYDAPTGGNAVWNGEVQKLTVNGGLVSTLLGSKFSLDGVDFNQALYLEITVDAQAVGQAGNGVIDAADPPLLPRQSILPAVFAVEAQSARDAKKLAGSDWSALFTNSSGEPVNDPTGGRISAARLAPGSITNAQLSLATITGDRLAADTLTANQIGVNAVGTSELAENSVTSGKISDGTIQSSDIASGFGFVPTGTVVAFAGNAAPAGWLLCDGAAVSRTTYATLFGVIGNSHGVGDGASTFNLPDYRGRFLRGVDGSALRDPDSSSRAAMATGGNSGNAVGSVQADEFKSHTHSTIQMIGDNAIDGVDSTVRHSGEHHNAPRDTGNAGGSETRPNNAYVNYIIKC